MHEKALCKLQNTIDIYRYNYYLNKMLSCDLYLEKIEKRWVLRLLLFQESYLSLRTNTLSKLTGFLAPNLSLLRRTGFEKKSVAFTLEDFPRIERTELCDILNNESCTTFLEDAWLERGLFL